MHITPDHLSTLAERLVAERKQQGLSRSQAAAVCNVSPSFIRDAESAPERCSLGKLLQLVGGLGLSLEVHGWTSKPPQGGIGNPATAIPSPPSGNTAP
ncbi:helix-turn-helix domain-containing protein [Acidovorax sp. NCPPB 2350]|nr:helix-turn-helix domain-containing protein [Acidovorax sp. NCPPB 2350]